MEVLTALQEAIKKSDDKCAESIVESLYDYEIIEEDDWIAEGKYQYQELVFKIEGSYYAISQSRSGSPFSDYYYTVDSVNEVPKLQPSVLISVKLDGEHIHCKSGLLKAIEKQGYKADVRTMEGWN